MMEYAEMFTNSKSVSICEGRLNFLVRPVYLCICVDTTIRRFILVNGSSRKAVVSAGLFIVAPTSICTYLNLFLMCLLFSLFFLPSPSIYPRLNTKKETIEDIKKELALFNSELAWEAMRAWPLAVTEGVPMLGQQEQGSLDSHQHNAALHEQGRRCRLECVTKLC